MIQVDFKRVPYDAETEIKAAQTCDFPYVDLYIEQVKQGKTRTHDMLYLNQINQFYGYQQDVLDYFKQGETQ